MGRIITKLTLGLAITTIGLFASDDNSLGTWTRNVAKSKSTAPGTNPIVSATVVREASDGGVKVTITGQRKDGTAINSSYSCKYDGNECPVTGAPWDITSIKQIDANTFTSEMKKTGGKYHANGRTVISDDGKTMTITTEGTNDEGKPVKNTLVYEKQ